MIYKNGGFAGCGDEIRISVLGSRQFEFFPNRSIDELFLFHCNLLPGHRTDITSRTTTAFKSSNLHVSFPFLFSFLNLKTFNLSVVSWMRTTSLQARGLVAGCGIEFAAGWRHAGTRWYFYEREIARGGSGTGQKLTAGYRKGNQLWTYLITFSGWQYLSFHNRFCRKTHITGAEIRRIFHHIF